jgi:predicted nuclease with TOPRIM domain
LQEELKRLEVENSTLKVQVDEKEQQLQRQNEKVIQLQGKLDAETNTSLRIQEQSDKIQQLFELTGNTIFEFPTRFAQIRPDSAAPTIHHSTPSVTRGDSDHDK